MSGSRRRCPLCHEVMDAAFCPTDRISTLVLQATTAPPSSVEPGALVGGRYEVLRVIGQGGFGKVFEARHLGTGQGMALKILASHDDSEVAASRFFREARVTAGLSHPNTVRVFDFGQDDSGVLYLAMELLCGMHVRDALRERLSDGDAFAPAQAIAIAVSVTRSLIEAHAAGLIHRDLKPSNVFLHELVGDEPLVKVLDFGIVKLANAVGTLTAVGRGVPGTPEYMSPEQARNATLDARTDLYSLGVMLFEMLTGRVPFRGRTDVETLMMQARDPAPRVAAVAPQPLDDRLVQVVERALAKRPENRFSSAAEMRDALLVCAEDSDAVITVPKGRLLAASMGVPPAETVADATRPASRTTKLDPAAASGSVAVMLNGRPLRRGADFVELDAGARVSLDGSLEIGAGDQLRLEYRVGKS